jgi:hypothetical protein
MLVIYQESLHDARSTECKILKTKAIQSIETSIYTHPVMQRQIPEDRNPQQQCCKHFKPYNQCFFRQKLTISDLEMFSMR